MAPNQDSPEILVEEQRQIVEAYLTAPATGVDVSGADLDDLRGKILTRLREIDGVLIAHYYTDPLIQELAEMSGGVVSDSLEMARFGNHHSAETLVVAGVRFMGETAKILTKTTEANYDDISTK